MPPCVFPVSPHHRDSRLARAPSLLGALDGVVVLLRDGRLLLRFSQPTVPLRRARTKNNTPTGQSTDHMPTQSPTQNPPTRAPIYTFKSRCSTEAEWMYLRPLKIWYKKYWKCWSVSCWDDEMMRSRSDSIKFVMMYTSCRL